MQLLRGSQDGTMNMNDMFRFEKAHKLQLKPPKGIIPKEITAKDLTYITDVWI
jgi:hypothetical protein